MAKGNKSKDVPEAMELDIEADDADEADDALDADMELALALLLAEAELLPEDAAPDGQVAL
jgi:hypothetical protein